MNDSLMRASTTPRWLRAIPIGFAWLVACTAHADCSPVIAAYLKADATKRYALFDVDSLTAAPTGDPLSLTIGGASYTQKYVQKGPFEIVKAGYQKGSSGAAFEASSLKSREQKGEVRCEPLGERKIGAEQVVGYRIRDNDKSGKPDVTAIEIWISRPTGLPLWHGMGSDAGGFRWVFGAGVSAPSADKMSK
jgi:hypothetical protein